MQELNPAEWAVRPLKNYAVFSGRAPRAEYWWFVLLYVVARIAAYLLDSTFQLGDSDGSIGWLTLIVILGFLIPQIAVSIRRLHDSGKSGWWLLAGIVPLIGLILLFFMAQPGDEGPNDYGPDPYGGDELEEVFA